MQLKDLAGPVVQLSRDIAAITTASTTAESSLGRAPFKSKVVGAYFIAESALSGAASNNRVLSVVNKVSGAGSAIPATLIFTAGVDAIAYDDTALTVSATDATVALAAGDVLSVQSLVTGTGLAQPAGKVVVLLQALGS